MTRVGRRKQNGVVMTTVIFQIFVLPFKNISQFLGVKKLALLMVNYGSHFRYILQFLKIFFQEITKGEKKEHSLNNLYGGKWG